MTEAAVGTGEVQVDERNTSKPSTAALRLRKHAHYQRAYAAAARKQHSREMSFFFARRDRIPTRTLHPDEVPVEGPRIGLTVPKALGKAHDRNRIKRRMRAAVALHAGELGGLAVDVILHPRRTVLELEWEKLEREVREVFRTVRQGYDVPPGPASADRQRGRRRPGKAAGKPTPLVGATLAGHANAAPTGQPARAVNATPAVKPPV